jgi:DNA-binding response OmpR family regulator
VRVLVVEDEQTLARRVAEGLRDEGMAVVVCFDGEDALAKLDLGGYSVVLLDRDIPRCPVTRYADGSQVVRIRRWC